MLIWLVVAIIAAIGEVVSTGLFLATAAVAALITAALATVVDVAVIQVIVFGVLSLLGILVVRPFVVTTLGLDSILHPTSATVSESRLVGRHATVTQSVSLAGGQIRLGQSEFWSARPYDPSDRLSEGTPVEIMAVDRLTALVSPVDPPALPPIDSSIPISEKGESL